MDKNDRIKIFSALVIPFLLTAICWLTYYLDTTQNLELYRYGILPRTIEGLYGIIFTPFIHDAKDISHIINNSMPLLFLGWCLFYFYREVAWKVLLFIWLAGGFWLWLIQDDHYHIGASGVVYGLASFLFYSGVIRRNKHLMALTLLVAFLYGGMIWGIFPYDIRISWQSHLLGGIAGFMAAWYYRKTGMQREKYDWNDEEVETSFPIINKNHEEALMEKVEQPKEEDLPQIVYHYSEKKGDTEDK